jgi:signal transduction histidine kinase/CheY-like chemotaxis protein
MTDAVKLTKTAVHGESQRVPFGLSFWLLLMLVEALLMYEIGRLALTWAQELRYGVAALLLIGSTALCGVAIFAAWYSQNKVVQGRLARERAAALLRKSEAEAQAQQKSRLLATMSHEIRTPLNGVIGMLGLLQETELNGEQKNYAGMAHSSARSLLSFLDEILDTAKAEARQDETKDKTELLPLMETVAELMSPRAHAKGIEVSTYVAANVPAHVPFNSLHMRQVLFNLAGNAIKFTAHGGVAIEARIENARLLISVRDTGIGMTEEEAQRVFLEFEQASNDTQRRYGGTGLGLAISKKLVESMSGSISVESEKGKGTTFRVSLPCQSDQKSEQASPLLGRSYGLWSAPSLAVDHLVLKLKDHGAKVLFPGEAEIETCTAIICDPTEARNLVALRSVSTDLKSTPIWVLLNPEERRSLKSILAEPATGYLVKPLRATSLVSLLTGQDSNAIESGIGGLRKVTAQSKPRQRKSASLKLLLVDDTAVNLLLASTMLRRMGHQVTTANSGEEALTAIENGSLFDAVLLDIEMPRMDGHEVTRRIRAQGHISLPVLALTGNASAQDIAACMASGMNGHVAKPFEQEDLHEALAKLMRNKAA